MKSDCCQDKSVSLKIHNDQVKTKSSVFVGTNNYSPSLFYTTVEGQNLSLIFNQYSLIKINHPPPLAGPEIIVKQQAFRI
jgi:hypothetical protein